MEIGGNWKIQSLPWLYACIRFTVYYFVPYFTPCLLKYKIFTYWFPQNATFLSNLLWKSWLTALLVLRGVALVGLPGPAALFLTSMLCLISVFSEPAVFSLEGRDKQQDFILLSFYSNNLFLVRIWAENCTLALQYFNTSCGQRMSKWRVSLWPEVAADCCSFVSGALPGCFRFLGRPPLPSLLVPFWHI